MPGLSPEQVMDKARRAVAALREEVTVDRALVFGSHAEGTAHEWSDIDLAVFTSSLDEVGLDDLLRLNRLAQRAGGPHVELHLFPARRLDPAQSTAFSRQILAAGLTVV